MKLTRKCFQSTLGTSIDSYLRLKRVLGRRYAIEERVLQSLDYFMAASGRSKLTASIFTSWCRTLQYLTPTVRRNHMRIVRNYCLYRQRSMPSCFVPDPVLFPAPHQPIKPYIFGKEEIVRLIATARKLEPTYQSPLRSEVYALAIVLLYTTGLRRGELLKMTLGDYNAEQRTLFVRQTKFHKSRYLPLSPDGHREVEHYLQVRRRHGLMLTPVTPLMWNQYVNGPVFTAGGLAQGLRALFRKAGIQKLDGRLPRVHDLRHTFAAHALLRWYKSGADVQAKLPLLATYMGHVSIVSTEYYLQFIEPLASSAAARFSKHCGALVRINGQQKGSDQ